MSTIRTVLVSDLPLPYSKIGSWPTMLNYYLENNTGIDYIISPKSDMKLESVQQMFVKPINLYDKIQTKLNPKNKFDNYVEAFKVVLTKEERIILQVVDNLGLLITLTSYIEEHELRDKVYVQFFFHGHILELSEALSDKVDELIVLSELSYVEIKQRNTSFPVKVTVNHNGIDSLKFQRVTDTEKKRLRNHLDIPEDTLVFTWCSQDRKKKGLELLLQAWDTLYKKSKHSILLLIIGSDKPITMDGVNVVGRVKNDEVPGYLQASDFYVFPSLWQEGFGMSLAEALKCGTYCIASEIGGIPEVLDFGKYGDLVKNPHMTDSWTKAILNAIDVYERNNRKNPFDNKIPEKIYDLEDWCVNYNTIIQNAKTSFKLRFYL